MKNMFSLTLLLTFLLIGVQELKSQTVSMKYQTQLILKILQFDRNHARFGNPITIGASSEEIVDAFKDLGSKSKLGSIPVSVEKMGSVADVGKYKIVYIDDNWSDSYANIAETAKANQILVISRKEDSLKPCGGISFRRVLNKPKILIHNGNLTAQGTKFPGNVMRIAIVIDK